MKEMIKTAAKKVKEQVKALFHYIFKISGKGFELEISYLSGTDQAHITKNALMSLVDGCNTPPVIIHGGTATGKTTNALSLAKHYKCKLIVDDWMPGLTPLKPGMIALTEHNEFSKIHSCKVKPRIYSIEKALEEMVATN